jgi:hypothetical protein
MHIRNIKRMGSLVKCGLLVSVTSMLLSACVTYIGPGPGPRPGWVPGHYNRFGAWVPGHYNGPAYPRGGVWVPGHYNRFGAWVPGHWR